MAPPKSLPNDEIRRLYRLPLEEFTAARNELAKRLRLEKDTEAAQAVQALAKPTASAWAVNVLFERERKKMEALVAAGERARAAQGEVVSGRGAAALKEALRAARGLSDELRGEAGRILAERGRPPGREVLERISASLQALAVSPSSVEAAARGWLDHDLEPPGFEVLAGLPLAEAPVFGLAARRQAEEAEEEEVQEPEEPRRRAAEEARKKKEEARRREEAAEAARREREAEERRRRIAAAKEKVVSLEEEAGSLREAARRAEVEAKDARRRAETAERAAERAREKAETVARRLEIAREQLREAGEG